MKKRLSFIFSMQQKDNIVLYACTVFDYLHFLREEKITDCVLEIVTSQGVIEKKAHRMILANSSEFFFNAFTAEGMIEEQKHTVRLEQNPKDLLTVAIDFIYGKQIEFQEKDLMPMYQIAAFYGITNLQNQIKRKMDEYITSSKKLMKFVNQCYDEELPSSLSALVPLIASFYKSFDMRDLSNALDCQTFVKILESECLESINLLDKSKDITSFVGENPNDDVTNDDKVALSRLIGPEWPFTSLPVPWWFVSE